jgi:hypothetical protein
MKNILEGRKVRRTEVKQYTPPPPPGSGGIINQFKEKDPRERPPLQEGDLIKIELCASIKHRFMISKHLPVIGSNM